MRREEPNQVYESAKGSGKERCAHRCKVTKYEIETGKLGNNREKIISTQDNICRLKTNQNKRCSWANDSEHTCHIPRK